MLLMVPVIPYFTRMEVFPLPSVDIALDLRYSEVMVVESARILMEGPSVYTVNIFADSGPWAGGFLLLLFSFLVGLIGQLSGVRHSLFWVYCS